MGAEPARSVRVVLSVFIRRTSERQSKNTRSSGPEIPFLQAVEMELVKLANRSRFLKTRGFRASSSEKTRILYETSSKKSTSLKKMQQ